jgi:hypothetical protein
LPDTLSFTPYIEWLFSSSNPRAENFRLTPLPHFLRPAIERTILGVVEASLPRMN